MCVTQLLAVQINNFYPWNCHHRRFHLTIITHASQTMVPILLFHYLPSCLHLIHCQKKQGRVESLDGLDWNTLFRYFSLHMQYCFRYASLYIQFCQEEKTRKCNQDSKIPSDQGCIVELFASLALAFESVYEFPCYLPIPWICPTSILCR